MHRIQPVWLVRVARMPSWDSCSGWGKLTQVGTERPRAQMIDGPRRCLPPWFSVAFDGSGQRLHFPDATVTDSGFGSLSSKNYGTDSLWNPRILQLTAQLNF